MHVQEFVEHGVEFWGQEVKQYLMVLSCIPLSVCFYSLNVYSCFHSEIHSFIFSFNFAILLKISVLDFFILMSHSLFLNFCLFIFGRAESSLLHELSLISTSNCLPLPTREVLGSNSYKIYCKYLLAYLLKVRPSLSVNVLKIKASQCYTYFCDCFFT